MTFDPWTTTDDATRTIPNSPDDFRPTLVIKAKKRQVVPTLDPYTWQVLGDEALGDSHYDYTVTYDGIYYECSCYSFKYGETRQRSACSHVVAVVLYRKNNVPMQGVLTGIGETNTKEVTAVASAVLPTPAGVVDAVAHSVNTIALPDPREDAFGTPALPEWLTELRQHQWDAVQEVIHKFEQGNKIVFLDAPTGSGKTLIAELVRRLMHLRALYVCSTKTLQDQFVRDYPYSAVLKGRSNYPTVYEPYPDYTAADCTKSSIEDDDCYWCPTVNECAYEIAKRAAYQSPIAVINTSYLLTEANYVGGFSGRKLVILDECDVVERELMGFVEYNLSDRLLDKLGLDAPKKGVHKKTIQAWMHEELLPAIDRLAVSIRGSRDIYKIRLEKQLARLRQDTHRIDVENDNWIRDNDAGPLVLKPIRIDDYGQGILWRHGESWLCMSATIVSTDEMASSLGLNETEEQAAVPWDTVRVPMTFPIENRRIHVAPIANMVAKEKEQEWPKLVTAIRKIVGMHPGERVLVHTVSYDLARYLENTLQLPNILTYSSASERDRVLVRFRSTQSAILLAPSFDRGVDLSGDDCRVVIVAKIPFPFLGDKQVSARLNSGREGQAWYSVQTCRTLVQMTGRGVRSKDDWCTTYILDKQFVSNIWKKNNKHLLPEWWKEALDMRYPVRQLMT